MLRDILHGIIATQADLEIVANGDQRRATDEAISGAHVDVVLLGDVPSAHATEWGALIYRWPRLKVFALEQNGKNATLYELRPHREELGEVSPSELLQAIRESVSVSPWSEVE